MCGCHSNYKSLLSFCLFIAPGGLSLAQFMEHIAAVIPDKWKLVAIGLGLTMSQISAIDQQHRGHSQFCFAEVFDHWQRVPTSQRPVNWTTLVNILQCQFVGEAVLADRIQRLFPDD